MDSLYRFIASLLRSFVNLIVVFIHLPSYFSEARKKMVSSGDIHVLGNGPSFTNDYPLFVQELTDSQSVMVVNTFANTTYFETIKPAYYLLVDPFFFIKTSDQRIKDIQDSTLKSIKEKTNWKMQLLLPLSAKKSVLAKEVSANKNVSLTYFKNVPVYDGLEGLNHRLFRLGLANPPYRNVLIAGIFLSFKLGFTNIQVWGADHSWHEDLFLGKDNLLYVKDKHFYTENPKNIARRHADGSPLRMHEQLISIAKALSVYHSLESLTKTTGCRIVNRSSKSWIDAFDRR